MFAPNQRVAVISESARPDVGGVIGWIGTVVSVRTGGSACVVRLHSPESVRTVRIDYLIPLDVPEAPCAIRYARRPSEDDERVEGSFRLPGRGWDVFRFEKADVPRLHYELRLPMPPDRGGVFRIEFRVPRGVTLDRHYVLKAMSDALGVERWIETDA